MSVLSDIKAGGTQDILITATDNLNGFTYSIKTMLPNSVTQICVVHQIRNTMRYVVWKDKKEFVKDMKQIYTAPTKEAAKAALNDFKGKWTPNIPTPLKVGKTTGMNSLFSLIFLLKLEK